MTVVFNCFNSHTGGGITVATHFLEAFIAHNDSCQVKTIIVCSPKSEPFFKHFACNPCISIFVPEFSKKCFLFKPFFHDFFYLPHLLRSAKISILFNFSDIPSLVSLTQFFYFDWPFATTTWRCLYRYSKSQPSLLLYRVLKRLLFSTSLELTKDKIFILAQTIYQKKLLQSKYSIKSASISVYPNPGDYRPELNNNIFKSINYDSKSTKFILCLSAFYSHKNLEILPKVARLLSPTDNFVFLATFDPKTSNKAALLDREISRTPHIFNLGPVSKDDLPFIYSVCSAIILPTLLESYTGCFQEAFSYGKPILTSDRPFTREICKQAALYFDPLDPHSILASIYRLFNDTQCYNFLVQAGYNESQELDEWSDIVASIISSIPEFQV